LAVGLTVLHPDLPYPPLWHDSWLYHGYFIDLPGHLAAFKDRYYSSRISVTLPGHLAHRWLPPVPATLLLHLAVYLGGVIALYATVRQTVNRRAATLTALVLAGNCHYLQVVNSEYTDGYSVGYFLAATALLARAAQSEWWRLWVCAAGMATAALLVANVAFAVLVPPLVGLAWALNRTARRAADAAGFWVGVGGLAVCAVCGYVNLRAGGDPFFLAPSLTFVRNTAGAGAANPFREPLLDWLPMATWLLFPLAATGGAVAFLVRRPPAAPGGPVATWYQVQLLATVDLLVGLHCTPHICFLQVPFCATPILLPLALLAVAAQWGGRLAELGPGGYRLVCGLAVAAPLLLMSTSFLVANPVGTAVAALLLLGGVVLLQQPAARRPAVAAAAVALVCLADLGGWHRLREPEGYYPHNPAEHPLALADRGARRELFEVMHGTMRVVRTMDPGYQAVFWIDVGEPLGRLFTNLACLHCFNVVNVRLPDVTPWGRPLVPAMRVLVVSADEREPERARQAARAAGLRTQVLLQRTIDHPRYRFTVSLLETATDGPVVAGGKEN
ncbi:MAG: hypothetical protein U0736_05200, partial [Gemmataceae bacterium]